MSNREGMGRRACKDGTEMDHLTKSHRFYVENHGIRGKIKTARNNRKRQAIQEG